MARSGPLAFEPLLVPKPWGGRKLEEYGKSLPDHTLIGESWEIADFDTGSPGNEETRQTPVRAGYHEGKTLRQLIAELGDRLMGPVKPAPNRAFPLLVKLLDAGENLSVQVHPDGVSAGSRPTWAPKTESWYILEAAPGAVIYLGLRAGVDLEDIEATAGTAALVELLGEIPVRRGEFYHVPAGTVHALGAGVMVAEVQTPSDTTFRLYDWAEEYGRMPRTLHQDEAVSALRRSPRNPISLKPMEGAGTRLLIADRHYLIREHRLTDADRIPIADHDGPVVVMGVAGEARIVYDSGSSHTLLPGTTLLISARDSAAVRLSAYREASVLGIHPR